MATKTQRFIYLMERSGPKRPKKPRRPRRDVPVDTSKPGVSATDRKAGGGSTAARNVSLRAARKGGAALEDSRTAPSRKSTRRAQGRVKPAASLRLRSMTQARSPGARSTRGRFRRR